MMLRDMKDDRSRLKQDEIAFLIGRDLPERMKREMRWLFHLGEGNKANVIRLANLFEGPANPHVSREALSLIRRGFKGSDGGRHGKSPVQPWIAWILVRPLILALLATGYQLVGAKAPSFDKPH